MYSSGAYGHGDGFGFVDNDGRGQELAYSQGLDRRYQNQQYQQQFQNQDKPGFSQDIIEQRVQPQYQQQQHGQAPVQLQVLDPDQKPPQQWQ